jgi:hypothetical protein
MSMQKNMFMCKQRNVSNFVKSVVPVVVKALGFIFSISYFECLKPAEPVCGVGVLLGLKQPELTSHFMPKCGFHESVKKFCAEE